METNKPNVKRYDNTGCPEQICRTAGTIEHADGEYVLYADYEALQAECEKLRKDAERYHYIRKGNNWVVAAVRTGFHLCGKELDDLIDRELESDI